MINRGVISKKGQVTTFIIIGLVIVLVVGTGFFIRGYLEKRDLSLEEQLGIVVPQQVKPIKNFIDSCIEQTTLDGVRLLGLQGGHISLPPDQFITAAGNQFSNSLAIFNGFNVPYWYYEKASGLQVSSIPPLEQMNSELANYIDLNLEDCASGLSVFGVEGYTVDVENPETRVDIREDVIVVDVNYPLDIDLKGTRFEMSRFRNIVPLQLGRYYNVAKDIMEAENEHTFLENYTIDAMILYEDIPYDFVDFECAPKIWSTSQVEKSFKRAMALNIPSIRLVGTDYGLTKPSRAYFEQDVLNGDSNGLKVNFMYSQNWPLFMDVLEDDNGVLKGESVTRHLRDSSAKLAATFFCMNAYHFVYDIKYPVLVIINDDNALDGEGYTFQFATQVIIDNNQPRENILGTGVIEEDLSICDKRSVENTVIALAEDKAGDLVPVENADVEYKCLTTVCPLGKTSLDEFGEASLTTLFPPCVNGQVIVKKGGYFEGKTEMSSNNGEVTSVILKPYYFKKFNVKVIDPKQGIRDPFESEQVVFNLESGDYSTGFVHPSDLEEIRLIPGDYRVTSTVIKESERGITLQGSSTTKCFEVPKKGIAGFFGQTSEECVPIKVDSFEANQLIAGGAEFDWSVDILDLEQSNELTFYTYYNGFPNTVEGLTNIYDQVRENHRRAGFRYPEFE